MDYNSSNVVYKRTNAPSVPFEPIENLSKKRPSQTKLDIQKMYEDSLRLAAQYKELMMQNQQLKEQYQRVETIKHSRQNLIAAVQKIVEQKSKQINSKHANNFSWLVFKLNNKIYDLKAKIEAKEKAITEVLMSRESDIIRQKHTDIECLNEIVDFAKREGLVSQTVGHRDTAELSEIKEIVWMEQEIKEKETEIIEAEKQYQQEQKEVRRLMQALAKKKAELKSIKEMELEHQRAQELYKEEKKRKQQRIAGNKTYMQQLQNQKIEEQKKLENLKNKFKVMEEEQNRAIASLQQELQKLKAEYQERLKMKQDTVIKFNEEKVPVKNKNRVKRVTHNQVKLIGGNLNYSLALRGVSHLQISNYFPDQNKEQYSIRQVMDILRKYPFCMQNQAQALLLARYMIQDAGDGYFLQDMDTSQSVSVIRSILSKLIGEVKIYQRSKAEKMRQEIGPIVFKFGRLVQQTLQLEEGKNQRQGGVGKNKLISKQRMVDALESTISSLHSQIFMHEQIQFTIFYLFSWSKDLSKLELRRLFTMVEEDINWPSIQ